MTSRYFFAPLLPLAAAIGLASCGQGPVLAVNEAVVKLNPVESNPSALYFTIQGGPEPTTLEDVLSPSAVRVAMHETVRDPQTNVSRMEPLLRVAVPAKEDVTFGPGGKHVMLYGINLPARRLNEIDLVFVFGNGERIAVTAPIQPMGGAADDGAMEDMKMGNANRAALIGTPAPSSVPTTAMPSDAPAQTD
ncbi:MAG: copper chaperone PCu(A)C [Novosphingopyxis baekryungensis]|jgi:copper(I)-binding protein|nr:copper chaperone PCu(A)C [Novosphingopyxis baekryungensis]